MFSSFCSQQTEPFPDENSAAEVRLQQRETHTETGIIMSTKIGIIGGSGLDDPTLFDIARDTSVETPYGEPSSSLREGYIAGVPVVLLARHGRDHTIPPTQVNYRANIWALKHAGCTHVLASTAVGSLREEIERGDLILPDQFIDFT